MNPTLPLYLLLLGNEATSPDLSATLEIYSARWSVRFSPVKPLSSEIGIARDASLRTPTDVSAQAEALLARASTALSALREAEARTALTQTKRLLHAHPELPEAAWLMAEQHILSSELAAARGDGDNAWLRTAALALEGPRAEPFREGSPAHDAAPAPKQLQASIAGLSNRERVEWDGRLRHTSFATVAGEHRLRVLRGDRVVWAGWVLVNEARPRVEIELLPIAPCSSEDFEGTFLTAAGPVAAAGVRCPVWAVASPANDGLRIALCHASRCGSLHAPARSGDPFRPPAQPFVAASFPRWALWAAASVGAAAAASVVLWQAGAFSEAPPARERWIYEGLR
jgi:hypothetical protein